MPKKKYYTYDRITGYLIEPVSSIDEGKELIERYEKYDKWSGAYEEGHYDIVDEKYDSMLQEDLYAFI